MFTSTPITALTTTSAPSTTRSAAIVSRLEAGVARAVDQVDLAALPLEVSSDAGERHLPALLVLVPVGDRGAGLDRAQPVRLPGLEEHRLDERGLPGPAVSDDGDVADLPGLVTATTLALLGVGLGAPSIIAGSLRAPDSSAGAAPGQPAESRAFRRRIAFVWSCETRDSVTPSTSPISRRVSSS